MPGSELLQVMLIFWHPFDLVHHDWKCSLGPYVKLELHQFAMQQTERPDVQDKREGFVLPLGDKHFHIDPHLD